MMMLKNLLISLLLSVVILGAHAEDGKLDEGKKKMSGRNKMDNDEMPKSILEIAENDPENFSTLVAATKLVGGEWFFGCRWPFCPQITLFAPTNDAFAALGGTLETLLTKEYREHLKRVLLFHVLSGVVDSSAIKEQGTAVVATLEGQEVTATGSDEGVTVEGATVTTPDVEAANGIVHVVDSVLVPDFMKQDITAVAKAASVFEVLLAAAGATNLVETLQSEGPFTVFAPTDEAFAKLGEDTIRDLVFNKVDELRNILLYHVIPNKIILKREIVDGEVPTALEGASISIDAGQLMDVIIDEKSKIVDFDILASNGVIHVIDTVLTPETDPVPPPPPSDIVDIAVNDGRFTTLVAALTDAGLVDTLKGPGPFTVFAPLDSAFASVPLDQLQALVADGILLYHVLPGKIMRTDFENGIVQTISNENLLVSRLGRSSVLLNRMSSVVLFDIEASNGVIHVIDKVLIKPPSIYNALSSAPFLSTLKVAVDTAGLDETLKGTDGAPFTVFAPTDDAFSALPPGAIDALLGNIPQLQSVLLYHVAPGNFLFHDLENIDELVTASNSEKLFVEFDFFNDNGLVLLKVNLNTDQAEFQTADFLASNGIVHVITGVLSAV